MAPFAKLLLNNWLEVRLRGSHLQGARILIIEGEVNLLEELWYNLQEEGYQLMRPP